VPYPQDGLHADNRAFVGVPPSSSPQIEPITKEAPSTAGLVLVLVLIVVLAGHVIVAAYDATGRLLARVG
jgi:hypothetical protein